MELKDKSKKSRGKGNALVLIDVINDFDFPLAEALLRYALPAAKRIAALKERARRARIPLFTQTTISGSGARIFVSKLSIVWRKADAVVKSLSS